MRRLIKIALVVLGIRWFLRWRKRRHEDATGGTPTPAATGADPADELRRKLAASRVETEADPHEEATEPSVEARRADVHEQGRAALDKMTSSDEG